MTTLHLKKSIDRSHLRLGLFLIPLLVVCFALSPIARAVLPPPAPDGGYPNNNTAEGDNALFKLTTGHEDTAIGFQALFNDTTGFSNTAIGYQALFSNTTSRGNTAIGVNTLFSNTTGFDNTAIGSNTLASNTTGSFNTATSQGALGSNTSGNHNTADGEDALALSTTGTENAATGASALQSNTTGNDNTANGYGALVMNTTGKLNIALGETAGQNLTIGSNNIDVGNPGAVAGESNIIRIGTVVAFTDKASRMHPAHSETFIAGIHGVAVTGSTVVVNSTGQLGTAPSSARFKEAIKPMDKESEAILGLKPITFRYKEEVDPDKVPQFGLVAEEVEKTDPDLVLHDQEGKPFTVRYDAVNAMLLNEFLKEHRKLQTLEATVTQQQKQIEALTTTVRKVSERVELTATASQIAANDK